MSNVKYSCVVELLVKPEETITNAEYLTVLKYLKELLKQNPNKNIYDLLENLDYELGDDEYTHLDIVHFILDNNSFENTMDREIAMELIAYIMTYNTSIRLYSEGVNWAEKEFVINGQSYTVMAYGNCSEEDDAALDGYGGHHGIIIVD